jgi:hypothetical protein
MNRTRNSNGNPAVRGPRSSDASNGLVLSHPYRRSNVPKQVSAPPIRRASWQRYGSFAFALLGIIGFLAVDVSLARRYSFYAIRLLETLWCISPYLLTGVAAWALRYHRFASAAVLLFSGIDTFWACKRYIAATNPEEMPFFILGLLPMHQIFALIAFLSPVVAVVLYTRERSRNFKPKPRSSNR